ncbi:hypothetical protein EDC01DRAFT_781930 [Geopyxis carbonaria]|nr:hypothetical protein EDC01DRAFT_781930 [Geopyxis carbonaria]
MPAERHAKEARKPDNSRYTFIDYDDNPARLRDHDESIRIGSHVVHYADEEYAQGMGIKGVPVLAKLPSIVLPWSFPYDNMHLPWENIVPKLFKHYRGVFQTEPKPRQRIIDDEIPQLDVDDPQPDLVVPLPREVRAPSQPGLDIARPPRRVHAARPKEQTNYLPYVITLSEQRDEDALYDTLLHQLEKHVPDNHAHLIEQEPPENPKAFQVWFLDEVKNTKRRQKHMNRTAMNALRTYLIMEHGHDPNEPLSNDLIETIKC